MVAVCILGAGLIATLTSVDPEDALWKALQADYPGNPDFPVDAIRSEERRMISSRRDDQSLAVSYASDTAFHLQRTGSKKKRRQIVSIPWNKIARIEVIAPSDDILKKYRTPEATKLLSANLIATVNLLRESNSLNLIVPWHYAFRRKIPSTVEFVMQWNWPGAR